MKKDQFYGRGRVYTYANKKIWTRCFSCTRVLEGFLWSFPFFLLHMRDDLTACSKYQVSLACSTGHSRSGHASIYKWTDHATWGSLPPFSPCRTAQRVRGLLHILYFLYLTYIVFFVRYCVLGGIEDNGTWCTLCTSSEAADARGWLINIILHCPRWDELVTTCVDPTCITLFCSLAALSPGACSNLSSAKLYLSRAEREEG